MQKARNSESPNQIRFCRAVEKQDGQAARDCNPDRAGRCAECSRFLWLIRRKENSPTNETARDRAKKRESFGEAYGATAARRKNVCSDRNLALHDAGRGLRENRSGWRSRQQ